MLLLCDVKMAKSRNLFLARFGVYRSQLRISVQLVIIRHIVIIIINIYLCSFIIIILILIHEYICTN